MGHTYIRKTEQIGESVKLLGQEQALGSRMVDSLNSAEIGKMWL